MPILEIQRDDENETAELRMIHLLVALSDVPTSLVFSGGPKLSTPGWRWAPTSFLQSTNGELSTVVKPGPRACATSDGLRCTMDAMLLALDIGNAAQFSVIELGVSSAGPITVANPRGEAHHWTRLPPADPLQPRQLVLLLNEPMTAGIATTAMLGLVTSSPLDLSKEMTQGTVKSGAKVTMGGNRDNDVAENRTLGRRFVGVIMDRAEASTPEEKAMHIDEMSYANSLERNAGEDHGAMGEEQEISVECLRVMVVVRMPQIGPSQVLEQQAQHSLMVPGVVMLGKKWLLA